MAKALKRLSALLEEVRWEDATSPKWWVNFARRQVRLYFYIARETVHDRCLQQAAALTFTTLLSLVPLLAVAFSFFRGFDAFKGLEKRAQRAIFEQVLAAPLSKDVPGMPGADEDDQMGELSEMSAEELLERAEGLPRLGNSAAAAKLYLEALERGADAGKVRRGLSSLRLSRAVDLSKPAGELSDTARLSYAAAARALLPDSDSAKPSSGGLQHYGQAAALRDRLDYEGAIDELKRAEAGGYPLWKTRLAMADVQMAMSDSVAEQQDHQRAVEHYWEACESFTDALVLGGDSARWAEARQQAALDHEDALQRLAELYQAMGREQLSLHRLLADTDSDQAQDALDKAIEHLGQATRLMENPAESHTELADLLWTAQRQEEARTHYKQAAGQAVAARGFSTEAAGLIQEFTEKVGHAGIGMVGILFLIVTATSLLSTVEKTLNSVWKVEEKRSFWTKFTAFCTLIWLGPAMIGVSILARERLSHHLSAAFMDVPVLGAIASVVGALGRFALPFVTVWLVLVALYKFLPHTRVRFSAAAWGAFIATILIEIARVGFHLYATNAMKYEKMYGALAAIPLFLLWLWLLWVVVLFGAEVAFTVQNVGLLRFRDRLRRLSRLQMDRYLAARIMMYVAREFWQNGQPMAVPALAETLGIPPEESADAASKMVKLGLLTPVGEELDQVHPAKDLSQLTVMEVLSVTDRFRSESRSTKAEDSPYERRLEAIFDEAIASQQKGLEGLTFLRLLQECAQQEADDTNEGQPDGE